MIHSIDVSLDSSIEQIKKVFRKKLMTGGARIELSEDVLPAQHDELFLKFIVDAKPNNIQCLILTELGRAKGLSKKNMARISTLQYPAINRALLERDDLPSVLRGSLVLGTDESTSRDAAVYIESKKIESMTEDEVRNYFLDHLGDEQDAIVGRIAICQQKKIPEDLKYLLERDSNRRVRFQLRYQEKA